MWKYIRVLLGLFLAPCCVAITRSVYFLLAGPGNCAEPGGTTFWLGIGAGLVLWIFAFIFLPPPVKSYVLAHELTHALWGYFFGATVLGMRVSGKGGSVKLSESNFLVVLAPYFFPLYTLLIVGGWFLASVFMDLQKYFPLLLAAMGFTLGFHVCFTIPALGQRQPDIEQYGRFFSYTLIYLMNLLAIGVLLVLVAPVSLFQFAARLATDFRIVWEWIWKLFADGIIAGMAWLVGAG